MNQRAANEFKTSSDLSEDEIADLEDEVIHRIEAGADLVPFPSLSAFTIVGCILRGLRAKFLIQPGH